MITPQPLRLLSVLLASTLAAVTGCDWPADPFTTGPGHASVHGQVTDAAGGPIVNTTVRIACAGASAMTIATDTLGVYGAGLSLPAAAFEATGGRPTCRFTEPGSGTAQIQLDTALGFARGTTLVPLQLVDLQRP